MPERIKEESNMAKGGPVGNQFWKLRAKHGRDKLFATPELLWEAACEYFQWCEDNPLIAQEAKTVNIGDYMSEIQMADIPKMRAFTIQGLCIYLDCHSTYFNEFAEALKGKEDQMSRDFSQVVTRIREVIYHQKFTGAAAGFLNANIIARDLGLAEKQHNTISLPAAQIILNGSEPE